MWNRTMILPDTQALAEASADWLAEWLRQKPDALLCIAAGHTQREMLAIISALAMSGKLDFSRVHVVGLDEWVGLGPEDEGSRQHMLSTEFLQPVGLRPDQVTLFNAKADDLDAECERMDSFLDLEGPIDLLVLGVGLNGHVGFNEPGAQLHQRSHYLELDPVSTVIGQKYFQKPRELKHGITLGLHDLTQARKILIQVTGEAKAMVVRSSMAQPHQPGFPVSHFWPLQATSLFMDRAAASLLPNPPMII